MSVNDDSTSTTGEYGTPLPIGRIKIPETRQRQEHDVESLAQSISLEGLHNPILVREDPDEAEMYVLISGYHRIQAFKRNGYTRIPATVKNSDETYALLAEVTENLERYDLTKLEKARHIATRDQIYASLGFKKGPGRPRKNPEGLKTDQKTEGPENVPTIGTFLHDTGPPSEHSQAVAGTTDTTDTTPDNVRTLIGNADLARQMGMSTSGARDYRAIAKNIPAPLHKALLTMDLADNLKELRKLSKLDVREQIQVVCAISGGEAKTISEAVRSLSRGRTRQLAEDLDPVGSDFLFRTIVLDPPWDPKDTGDINPFGKIQSAYSTMSRDEIAALPVADLAEPDDCHLYLWVTGRTLPLGFELMEEWGFRYIQPIVWIKHRQGLGRYYANQLEFLLFGIKGARLLAEAGRPNVIEDRRLEHSRKPDSAYELIREMSPGPRLEMFARDPHEGFVAWGAEAGQPVTLGMRGGRQ